MSYPSLEDKQEPSRTPMQDSEQPDNFSCTGRLIPEVRILVHTEQKAGGSPQYRNFIGKSKYNEPETSENIPHRFLMLHLACCLTCFTIQLTHYLHFKTHSL
jgi:hypothetical protein